MILEMKVPSPGESITEVEIATWLVKDGDYVEKDQAIAEVDSDKATLELPAEAAGIITLKAEEGDAVKVGQVVCLIDTDAAGRAYAAYGGIYICASLAWLWAVEGARPDRWDLLGGAVSIVGTAIILFGPRNA